MNPLHSLDGKVAVVTGGGSSTDPIDVDYPGTGFAVAVDFARHGGRVVVLDRDQDAADRTVGYITAEGGEARGIRCDVTDEADVRAGIGETVDAYGRVDCVVNNAGVGASGPVLKTTDRDWDHVLRLNVRSVVYTLRYAEPHMRSGSSVVNISSTAASRPHRNRGAYPTSKGAVNALTASLAVDLGPKGIRVNAVAPGSIWTPMGRNVLVGSGDDPAVVRERRAAETTLLQQVGTAWDVAAAAIFLCSPASRWITGQVLTIDGGGSVLWGTRALHVDLDAGG